jgi:hypothetical protein
MGGNTYRILINPRIWSGARHNRKRYVFPPITNNLQFEGKDEEILAGNKRVWSEFSITMRMLKILPFELEVVCYGSSSIPVLCWTILINPRIWSGARHNRKRYVFPPITNNLQFEGKDLQHSHRYRASNWRLFVMGGNTYRFLL